MAITIQSIIEEIPDKVKAKVLNGEGGFIAHVKGSADELQKMIGSDVIVEMDYERIVSWRLLKDFNDSQSGMFSVPYDESCTKIRGCIHNIVEIAPGQAVIDLYLLNGADFLSIDINEIEDIVPEIVIGMELVVEGLCFYPTNT